MSFKSFVKYVQRFHNSLKKDQICDKSSLRLICRYYFPPTIQSYGSDARSRNVGLLSYLDLRFIEPIDGLHLREIRRYGKTALDVEQLVFGSNMNG